MDGVDTTGEDEQNSEDVLVECLKCGSSAANIVAVDCGADHGAMSSNGRVWCWGSGKRGQLGSGNYTLNTVAPGCSQNPFGDEQGGAGCCCGGESTCALTCKGMAMNGMTVAIWARYLPSQSTDDEGNTAIGGITKWTALRLGRTRNLPRQAKQVKLVLTC